MEPNDTNSDDSMGTCNPSQPDRHCEADGNPITNARNLPLSDEPEPTQLRFTELPKNASDSGIFDTLLEDASIFQNKEVLRPSFTPRRLPHRNGKVDTMATILVGALRGETPSNILIYGKTGTGKTASARYVGRELEKASAKFEVPCEVEYINCEVTDTQYRVLAQLANRFIEKNLAVVNDERKRLAALPDKTNSATPHSPSRIDTVSKSGPDMERLDSAADSFEKVPMTGWPTDRVYEEFFDAVDYSKRVAVIMLDEIDKLVEKSGDDTLYTLSRMNSNLEQSKVSIIGISNDLTFTEYLDPRVKSSLGEEEIVFPPYDAIQLRDILQYRSESAFYDGVLTEEVIPLCAAFAAQEHGDARRALDLVRTAGEIAQNSDDEHVREEHVRDAQAKIEIDRIGEVVRTLPIQSKIILLSVLILEDNDVSTITTGEAYNTYEQLCDKITADVLTQRRVTELISELDMLGIVNAIVVSNGRYGRTKEITLSVSSDQISEILFIDSRLQKIRETLPAIRSSLNL